MVISRRWRCSRASCAHAMARRGGATLTRRRWLALPVYVREHGPGVPEERRTIREVTTMRKSHVVFSAFAAAASLATAPAATADPGAFGAARQGSLIVASSALISKQERRDDGRLEQRQ